MRIRHRARRLHVDVVDQAQLVDVDGDLRIEAGAERRDDLSPRASICSASGPQRGPPARVRRLGRLPASVDGSGGSMTRGQWQSFRGSWKLLALRESPCSAGAAGQLGGEAADALDHLGQARCAGPSSGAGPAPAGEKALHVEGQHLAGLLAGEQALQQRPAAPRTMSASLSARNSITSAVPGRLPRPQEDRALAAADAVRLGLQLVRHRRQLLAQLDEVLVALGQSSRNSNTSANLVGRLLRAGRRGRRDRPARPGRGRRRRRSGVAAAASVDDLLQRVDEVVDLLGVLYRANEARAVPGMPKRSISGWQQ